MPGSKNSGSTNPRWSLYGHVLSRDGVSTDPAKASAIVEREPLWSRAGVRAFLGVTGYHRDFLPRYAEIPPLTEATKDDVPATSVCNESQQTAGNGSRAPSPR